MLNQTKDHLAQQSIDKINPEEAPGRRYHDYCNDYHFRNGDFIVTMTLGMPFLPVCADWQGLRSSVHLLPLPKCCAHGFANRIWPSDIFTCLTLDVMYVRLGCVAGKLEKPGWRN